MKKFKIRVVKECKLPGFTLPFGRGDFVYYIACNIETGKPNIHTLIVDDIGYFGNTFLFHGVEPQTGITGIFRYEEIGIFVFKHREDAEYHRDALNETWGMKIETVL